MKSFLKKSPKINKGWIPSGIRKIPIDELESADINDFVPPENITCGSSGSGLGDGNTSGMVKRYRHSSDFFHQLERLPTIGNNKLGETKDIL